MGRKSLRDETTQANVINLSWTTILRALHSPKLSLDEKRKIALAIVQRTCPAKVKHSGSIDGKKQIINIIVPEKKSLKDTDDNRIRTTELSADAKASGSVSVSNQ